MKKIRFLALIILGISLNSCAIFNPTLNPPLITKNESIEEYKYIFIPTTSSLTSEIGSVYNGYGSSISKTVNPKDIISGILLKKGFIIIPEIKDELKNETIIINYGESGKRLIPKGLGGYSMEVTVSFISAKNYKKLCSCTAEGIGETESDDIREAINRCLSGLLTKWNQSK